jgi:hypothetical protein
MERGGGGGAGKREEGEGRRGEGGGDARKLGWRTDNKTRHRGVQEPGTHSHAFFGSPLLNFSLSNSQVRVREGVQKLCVDEVFDLAHRHYP